MYTSILALTLALASLTHLAVLSSAKPGPGAEAEAEAEAEAFSLLVCSVYGYRLLSYSLLAMHTYPSMSAHIHSSRIIFGGKRDTAVDRIDLHPIPGTMYVYTDADVPSGSGGAGTASVAASYQLARLLCTADATDRSIDPSRPSSSINFNLAIPIRISGDNYRFKEKTDLFFLHM
ncbi:hypothetical protein KQX54_010742 [Cotesia glomerata]|uniref:Uncharacterized protein n=1 Tax=Cotesia glomerata TaxID=32391 RepID=A0AAV7J4N1_COTGL|nr:hypothetical protein KQX54_010742 [Cotesia glomerata]